MTLLIHKDGTISFRNASLLSIMLLILFISIILIFRNDAFLKSAFSGITMDIINLLATISLFYAAKFSKVYGKRVYLAWLFLGFGQLFFTLGDFSWDYIVIYLNQDPVFSISDVFYLVYYPLFALGIFLLPRTHFNRSDLSKIILDISIVSIAIGLLLWTFLIIPMFADVEGNIQSAHLSLSYVIFDFILLFALLDLIYSRISSLKESPLLLLGAGIIFQIISDVFYIYLTVQETFVPGNLVDLGWVIGFLLIGLAGILQANASIQKQKEISIESKDKPEEKEEVIRPEWTSYTLHLDNYSLYNLCLGLSSAPVD